MAYWSNHGSGNLVNYMFSSKRNSGRARQNNQAVGSLMDAADSQPCRFCSQRRQNRRFRVAKIISSITSAISRCFGVSSGEPESTICVMATAIRTAPIKAANQMAFRMTHPLQVSAILGRLADRRHLKPRFTVTG